MMKRSNMPNFWPISRKNRKYVVRPIPGPHSKETAIPLGVLIRDVFSLARNMNEVKKILNTGKIEVNGRICRKYSMPVGLMDVMNIGDDVYRMVPSSKGLKPIQVNDGKERILKIKNKSLIGKEVIQLNMFNGYNMLVKKDEYSTGDSLLVDNKTGSIKKHIKFDKGVLVVVVSGTNIGKIGKVEQIHPSKNMQPSTLTVSVDGDKILVPKRYVLVIGEDKSAVEIEVKKDE
ncbi:30S ribosomal protein S4e [archaeon]|nr:30S ribosomal protein S4e [archaeon]